MTEQRANPSAAAAPDDPAQDWPGGCPPPPCGPAQIAVLDELAEIAAQFARNAAELGMLRIERAKELTKTRQEGMPDTPLYDAAFYDALNYDPTPEQNRFDKMARTLRMIFGLRAKLLLDLAAWEKRVADAAAAQEQRLAEDSKQRKADLRRQVSAIVGEVVEAAHGATASIATIRPVGRWFEERLDIDRLLNRPIGEIVAEICRALDRPIDWSLWQTRPWGPDAMAATATAPGTDKAEPAKPAGPEQGEASAPAPADSPQEPGPRPTPSAEQAAEPTGEPAAEPIGEIPAQETPAPTAPANRVEPAAPAPPIPPAGADPPTGPRPVAT